MLKLVLFSHLLYTWSRGDVALMYESVEEFSRALYHAEVGCYAEMSAVACPSVARCPLVAQYLIFLLFLLLFLLVVLVVLGLHVEYHLQSFLVHGYLRLQARQVEIIFDEVFRHLSEVFVAQKTAKGRDPRLGDLRR